MPSLLSPSPLSPSQDLPTLLASSQTSLPPSLFMFSSRTSSLQSPQLISLWLGTSTSPTLLSPPPLDCCPVVPFFFLPLAILKYHFCHRKLFKDKIQPQCKFLSFDYMQQSSLWVALSEIKLTNTRTSDNSIASSMQNQTALFPNVDDQYWIGVQLNSQEVMPSTLASLSGTSVGINPYLKSQTNWKIGF